MKLLLFTINKIPFAEWMNLSRVPSVVHHVTRGDVARYRPRPCSLALPTDGSCSGTPNRLTESILLSLNTYIYSIDTHPRVNVECPSIHLLTHLTDNLTQSPPTMLSWTMSWIIHLYLRDELVQVPIFCWWWWVLVSSEIMCKLWWKSSLNVTLIQAESNHVSCALIDNKLVLIVTQVQICRTWEIINLSDTFSRSSYVDRHCRI